MTTPTGLNLAPRTISTDTVPAGFSSPASHLTPKPPGPTYSNRFSTKPSDPSSGVISISKQRNMTQARDSLAGQCEPGDLQHHRFHVDLARSVVNLCPPLRRFAAQMSRSWVFVRLGQPLRQHGLTVLAPQDALNPFGKDCGTEYPHELGLLDFATQPTRTEIGTIGLFLFETDATKGAK